MQVDKGRLLHMTLGRLSRLKEGEGLLLQPWKKDRAVCVIRRGEIFQVLERGFVQEEFYVEREKAKKVLKGVCSKEFPRSHKVWLRLLGPEEAEAFVARFSSM